MPHREPTFRLFVGGTITVLWATSLIVDFFNPTYDPPTGLQSLMLMVAGGLFAGEVVRSVRRGS